MAFELAILFSSRSRTKVLQVLYQQTCPIALRQVAYLADLAVRTVECTLQQLVKEELVKSTISRNQKYFSLNDAHPYYHFLANTFEAAIIFRLQNQAPRYAAKAKSAVEFASSFAELYSEVKQARQ